MPLEWNTVFDKISEGVLVFDRGGVFIYANDPAAGLFARKPTELIGKSVRDLVRNGEPEGLPEVILHSLDENRPAEIEQFSEVTGRWHAVRSYPGETGVTVFLQDITDKKLAEDSLRVSEAKFAGIVNISADAIISVDEDQRIIHFNSGAEEIFGWPASDIIGQSLDLLIPERFRAAHPQHIRNFAASPIEARRMGERREIAGLRRNGEEFPAEASISKLNVGSQRVFTVVLRDVTERKRLEETYRRLYEEAQRAVAARDDVLSFVSHDLGNPLAAIRIATAVLLKRIDANDPDGRHVAGIREAVEQAQRLIRDLLDIQKLEAGKLVLSPGRIDIDPLIDETIHGLRPLIDEKNIRIARESSGEIPKILADADRVTQIISNLIGNALKFSPQNATVTVTSTHAGNEVIVGIRDEGPGILAEHIPHIFDRYWQAKQSGKVGHGIGLSIVQAMVKAHGGRVWAESTFGSGSTFYFALPVEN
jgi:PAS domain S-box-containing protein